MALTLTVAGTDRTAQVSIRSLRIVNTIVADQTTAEMDFTSSGASWRPKAGNEIVIETSTDSQRHFAGNIIEVAERAVNRSDLHYTVSCKDYTWLFDRRMVTTTYGASAASAIVANIVTTYTTGFSTGGIQTASAVAQQRFDYVYPSDAIRSIADQLQWHWYIDFNKQVKFFDAITDIAPTTGINFDTDTTNYSDLVLRETASNVKNRIIVQGYKKASTVSFARDFQGDSTTRFFLFGYEPQSSTSVTATINGASVDVLIDGVDGQAGTATGTSSQVFVCFDNLGFRFSTGGGTVSSTQTLSLSSPYMLEGGIQYDDPTAQTNMAGRSSGDGVHMFVVNDPGLSNLASNDDLALAMGAAMTTRYGRPAIEGQFRSFLQGWRAGQYFTGNSATRMGGLADTFYVHRVEKSVFASSDGPRFVHDVTISNSALPL